jgi:EmrB/QacA subfamily drug resistance transporter
MSRSRAPSADPLPPIPPMTREQWLVTVGIMAAIAVAALDSTVVGTAMPTIIGDLGGLSEYGWVFSAYLLASTTTVPFYAKLADMVGRKPVFMFGLALFVGGSALCGLSGSMAELIAFRTLQGIGAGAVQPMSFTIAGDVFEPRQRARMQGFFSGVWGISAIVGPALGGIITTTVGWPWVFEINIPVGIVAGLIIWRVFHERFERREHQLDWTGGILLTAGIVALLVAVSEGAQLFGWTSPVVIGLIAAAVLLLVAFVRLELRAPEPLIDLDLLRIPIIGAGLALSVLGGIVMFGLTTYVPPMVQGVHGGSPIEAGAAVAAMSVGWPLGSIVGGRALIRFGGRPVVLVGAVMLVVGTALVTQIGAIDALWFVMVGAGITGLGMGLTATTVLVTIQGAVPWNRRGVATGLVQFSRTIGGAVGVGLMGGILTAFVGAASSAILDPTHPATNVAARADLSAGLGWIYWILLIAAIVSLVVAVRSMPDVHLGETPSWSEAPMRADLERRAAGEQASAAAPPPGTAQIHSNPGPRSSADRARPS